MDTNNATVNFNDLKMEKRKLKELSEDKNFIDFIGEIFASAVPDSDERKQLFYSYDTMTFIIENNKISILFKKNKTNPNQKKNLSETTQKVSKEGSMFELSAKLKASLKLNNISFKEHLNKEGKNKNIHIVIKI